MAELTKKCPMCAETIPLDAAVCEYCGARFAVTVRGYCTACHAMREADSGGKCKICGAEVADRQVETKFIEEAAPPAPAVHSTAEVVPKPPPAEPSASPAGGRNKLRVWILAGCLAGLLVCFAVGGVLWTRRGSLPVIAGLLATPTYTPTVTPRPTATDRLPKEIYAYCSISQEGSPVYVDAGQRVILHWAWRTASIEYRQDYIDAASFRLQLDGRDLDLSAVTHDLFPCVNESFCVDWRLRPLLLEAGSHEVVFTVTLSKEITDGFDLDGNPGLDLYGPGEAPFPPCEIIVR
jgi:hypothetical protein